MPSGHRRAKKPNRGATVKRSEKAEKIGEILDRFYPSPPIPLEHKDPYTLLVAVLLSAQTTDERVNEVTPALFALADHPAAMAALEVDQILQIVKPCGLGPAKSKAISKLSKLLLEEHGGKVPADIDALEALPGVGHKTASVVMAQAFGVPAFAVDTHIHRLAERWGLSSGKNVNHTERDLKSVFPEDTWSRRHLQLIFFGREHCPALFHNLAKCPICSWAATQKRIRDEATLNQNRRRRPPKKTAD